MGYAQSRFRVATCIFTKHSLISLRAESAIPSARVHGLNRRCRSLLISHGRLGIPRPAQLLLLAKRAKMADAATVDPDPVCRPKRLIAGVRQSQRRFPPEKHQRCLTAGERAVGPFMPLALTVGRRHK